MKIKMYADIYAGMDFKTLTAQATPYARATGDGVRRFAFELEIADKELFQADVELPGTIDAKEEHLQ